ncbi:hypothetical protein NZK32_15480, partial [Cyanobium sp. FGCU-52]|nr:hypothetical protein [Cyanobium sp. FGCU52]
MAGLRVTRNDPTPSLPLIRLIKLLNFGERTMTEKNDEAEHKNEGNDNDKKRKLLGLEPVETHHELALQDCTLKYTARAGSIALKDEFDETEAEVFFVAYEADRTDSCLVRPLTFVFNGGPGSSSVWLHMGAAGPSRVRMEDQGWMPPPPYELEPNENTWLDVTDLVFIDPVGTGFSRAVKKDLDKRYWSFVPIQGTGRHTANFPPAE